MRPATSRTSVPGPALSSPPIAATLPPANATSATASSFCDGSITRPPRRIRSKGINVTKQRASADGRPAPLAEPVAVVRRHLGALRLRRMPLASRCLLAVVRRGPPYLGAVVRIVGHLVVYSPIKDLLERQRPRRAIAA